MAWQGLTKILLDGLAERGPAVQPRVAESKLMLAFGVHGTSEDEAADEAKGALASVIGDDESAWAALRSLGIFDSEKLDQALQEIEKEEPKDKRHVYTRSEITSLVPRIVERPIPAKVINFRNEKG